MFSAFLPLHLSFLFLPQSLFLICIFNSFPEIFLSIILYHFRSSKFSVYTFFLVHVSYACMGWAGVLRLHFAIYFVILLYSLKEVEGNVSVIFFGLRKFIPNAVTFPSWVEIIRQTLPDGTQPLGVTGQGLTWSRVASPRIVLWLRVLNWILPGSEWHALTASLGGGHCTCFQLMKQSIGSSGSLVGH